MFTEIVKSQLQELEKKHSIRIIYAAEIGTRVYGLGRPDGTMFVRFVYCREPDWYLGLDKEESIQVSRKNVYNIIGYDIKTVIRERRNCRAEIVEMFLNAPLVDACPEFSSAIHISAGEKAENSALLAKKYFDLSNEYKKDIVRSNAEYMFYAMLRLRYLLCARFALDTGDFPPLGMYDLVVGLDEQTECKPYLMELLQLRNTDYAMYCIKPTQEIIRLCKVLSVALMKDLLYIKVGDGATTAEDSALCVRVIKLMDIERSVVAASAEKKRSPKKNGRAVAEKISNIGEKFIDFIDNLMEEKPDVKNNS